MSDAEHEEPEEQIHLAAQPGPQSAFLSTFADIALFGGAAGGGKSFALLLDPLRHHDNPKFGGVIFRRNAKQVMNEGGLWDESVKMYRLLGATPRRHVMEWDFVTGMRMGFAHLENEKALETYQGSQIPFIGFDELTHFTEKQFFYMMSRNRSTSGVPGYIRATCNPDVDSWVRRFIDWYIGPDGFAISERSGVLRWFIRQDDKIVWGDSRDELIKIYGDKQLPKSFTFIPSKLTDNKILMDKDPSYLSSLMALSRVDRGRLLDGNWNIRATSGEMFQQGWFGVLDAIPANYTAAVRFWDRAATRPTPEKPDPDWTRGLLLYKYPNNTYLIADLKSLRDTPGQVETFIKNVAGFDGFETKIVSQQDPGSAGVSEALHFTRMLTGYNVKTVVYSKDKITRAKPVSAQVEAGNVFVLRAPWNHELFSELEGFPDIGHDDIVDTLSGAFNELAMGQSIFDVL